MNKHPIDVEIGKRIRHRRWQLGMTQQQLGEKCGVKFQQIQKYETGANRVSASRLWEIAAATGMEVADFFDGIEAVSDESRGPGKPAYDFLREIEALPERSQKALFAIARSLVRETGAAYEAGVKPE